MRVWKSIGTAWEHAWFVAVVWAMSPPRVQAQPVNQLKTMATADDITSNGDAVTMSGTAGMASLMIQTAGTFSLTWELQCSGDGTTFDADDEVPVTLMSATPTPADAITSNAVALYTATIAGCRAVRVIATAYTSGTLTATLTAIPTGGSAGGGGSGGGGVVTNAGTFPVQVTQGGNTAAVNASGQLSTVCANCSGSGVSQVDNSGFVPSTTVFVPVGGEVDDTGTTAITENSAGAARLTTQRAIHVNLRNTAGAEVTPATDATHDSAASATGPQKMLSATTDLDALTAVANNDAVRAASDTLGRQITVLGCGTNNRIRGYLANTDGASTALTGMGAQGASVITEVWAFVVANSSATDVMVDIRDGTAGSVLMTIPAPATTDTAGGAVVSLPIPLTFTANTAVAIDTSAAASTVFVTALGCTVK